MLAEVADWSDRPMPEAWEVTPLNVRELVVAERLLEQRSGGGYLSDGGSGLRTRLSLVAPLPANAGKGHRYQNPHVRQCDLVRCGAGTVTGVGETTTSGSYLGVGETLLINGVRIVKKQGLTP